MRIGSVVSVGVFGVLVGCGGTTTGRESSSSAGGSGDGSGGAPGDTGGSSGAGGDSGGSSSGGAGDAGGSAGTVASGGTLSTGGCTGGPCPLEPPPVVCGGAPCAFGQLCCLTTLKCFDALNATADCSSPPPGSDPSGRHACASSADCAVGEFCDVGGSGLCGGVGLCSSETNCGSSFGSTFCGCDGNTYSNLQTACLAGVRLGVMGACGQETLLGGGGASAGLKVTPCGTDAQCPADQKCCGITGTCLDVAHAALCTLPPEGTSRACLTDADCPFDGDFCDGPACDGPGGCRTAGGTCDPVLDPVCGCDGKSYTNAGCAQTMGVRVAHAGSCP